MASLNSIWRQIGAHLEAERQRIYEEIKTYPRPIPACDLQFKHLLEKRAGIFQELDRMDEMMRGALGIGLSLNIVAEFIRSSQYLGGEMKQRITSALEGSMSRSEAKLAEH
jgi:hypothetical protein